MDNIDLKTITEAGAVGVAVILIILLYLVIKMNNKTVNNHMEHMTTAINNNTKAFGANSECIKQNTKLVSRVENKLDRL